MRCNRCELENRAGRKFCAACGSALSIACQECGFANEPAERYCGGCGHTLGGGETIVAIEPERITDPRFKTNALRVANKDALLPDIEALMRTQSRAEWIECLEAAGIPCAPVNNLAEAAREPQTEAVGILHAIPGIGEFVGLPARFNGQRPQIRRPAPSLGQHNAEVLPATMSRPTKSVRGQS